MRTSCIPQNNLNARELWAVVIAKIISSQSIPDSVIKDRREKLSKAQLDARAERKLILSQTKARRRDTRKKIIMGGALIALERSGDNDAIQMVERLLKTMRPDDLRMFSAPTESDT